MKADLSRNGWIEILRFLFACAIVGIHMSGYYAEQGHYFHSGYIVIDAFFVLTGLLAMISLRRSYCFTPELTPLQRLLTLLKKKWLKVYPLYLLSFVILFLFQETMEYHNNLYGMLNGFAAATGELLGVAVLGLGGGIATKGALYYNLPGWYFSAMLIGLAVVLFLAIWLKDLFLPLIAPGVAVLLYGYLHLKVGHLQIWEILGDRYLFPLWRAIAGLCLGAFASLLYDSLCTVRLRWAGRVLRSGAELLMAAWILWYAFRPWAQWGVVDFSVPFAAALLFPMLLSHSRVSGKMGDSVPHKAACWLGYISLPLWLNHYLVIQVFRILQLQGGIWTMYFSILAISVAVAVMVQTISTILQKVCAYLWRKGKNLLIES